MTQERFLKLLDNPDLLASISYEELKTLALTYPYAHNLRYLLAIKSRQDNHPEFSRNLAAAAANSLDRTRLFHLDAPKRLAPLPVEAEEQVLELKPIERVQQELQALAPVPRVAEDVSAVASGVQQAPVPDAVSQQSNIALDLSRAFEPEEAADLPSDTEMMPPVPESSEGKVEKTGFVIDFKPSFAVWAGQFNSPALSPDQPPRSTPGLAQPDAVKPAKRLEPSELKDKNEAEPETQAPTPMTLAEKSVTENKDILSETLARLYARQGYREKAIAMYERLGLAFPQKSAYFAAEIEKLKK
jgi:hypothetical protein